MDIKGFWSGLIFSCILVWLAKVVNGWGLPSDGMEQALVVLFLSAGTTVGTLWGWVVVLRRDKNQLKLVQKFIESFLDTSAIQAMVDGKLEAGASSVETAVQRSIQFQKGGLAALGFDEEGMDDEEYRRRFEMTKHNVEHDVKTAKEVFWVLYDLAEICANEFRIKVRTPRSFKNYLPTHSWQGSIPEGEKA